MKLYLTSTSIQNISLLFSPAVDNIERFRHSLDEIVKLQMRTFIVISSFLHSPFNGFGFCIFKNWFGIMLHVISVPLKCGLV